MKRVEVIVEGQTEKEFVDTILCPYLQQQGIAWVTPITIRTSNQGRGGFTKYSQLRNDIIKSLRSTSQDLIVTMFVDYFRIPRNGLPFPETWKDETDHFKQALLIEEAIRKDIGDYRFIPYIQMHEFEALLFSSNCGFYKYLDNKDSILTQQVIDKFQSPEHINTSPDGAPSKRLMAIMPNYNKVVYGNIFALEVGINEMLNKCEKFKQWTLDILSMK